MQSTCDDKHNIAIIMDGCGRWAEARSLPHIKGYAAGMEALRQIVKIAPQHGVETLTLFAFATDAWRQSEIFALTRALFDYLDSGTEELVIDGVRLSIIGRRDRLPARLLAEIERSEAATAWGDTLNVQIAIDECAVPDQVDVFIGTGGDQKLWPDFTGEDFAQALRPSVDFAA